MGRTLGFAHSCTPHAIDAAEKAALMGVPVRHLNRHTGTSRSTVMNWLAQGPDTPGAVGEFCQRVRAARATRELMNLANIHAAAEENWTASAWLLERSYGYTKEADHEEAPEVSGDLEELLMQAGPAALRKALAKLTQAGQG